MTTALERVAKKFENMTKLETADASNRHGDKLSHEVVSLISVAYKMFMQQVNILASKLKTISRQQDLKVRYKK
jgi:hypothetical protein